ncbi:hypothetical protein DFH01_25665 [Falsiroseomonas bella]|uniref:DUF6950 domain-containing protein n=1 Tax=Falsiroseomonas bella TaxID=2184016 RepID=A0A317F8S1_9PROT|nr:hypothetical protein [Falsiroseomonas bella]PWS34407.1 hypothetical protein DFH01_25665 [Falsiroseomonas bella]
MARRPDWPARLAALLAAAETRPFDAHRWNCGRFVLAAVHAVTGAHPRPRILSSLEATADSAGFPRIPPTFARAGDVVLAGEPPRLGVVVDGGRAAFVGPRGLVRAPLTTCTTAWRID